MTSAGLVEERLLEFDWRFVICVGIGFLLEIMEQFSGWELKIMELKSYNNV